MGGRPQAASRRGEGVHPRSGPVERRAAPTPDGPDRNEYVFDGLGSKATLLDLFDGHHQLIVYHFMFDRTDVFHTYSTYARGTDLLNSTFNYPDLTALGRQEPWEEPPGRSWLPASGWWWRRHDEYEQETNDTLGSTT